MGRSVARPPSASEGYLPADFPFWTNAPAPGTIVCMANFRHRFVTRSASLWNCGLALSLVVSVVAAACGSSEDSAAPPGGQGWDGGGPPDASRDGISSDAPVILDSMVTDADPAAKDIVVEPADPVLEVTGAPLPTQPFTAKFKDGTTPTAVNWSIDNVAVGTIATQGVFTPQGYMAGKATVTATVGAKTGSTTVTVKINLKSNPLDGDSNHKVSDPDLQLLKTGGAADADFRWLYPYDETVFPRGVDAPLMQLGGTPADSVLVKIVAGDFQYEGAMTASGPTRIAIPKAVWEGVTKSAGASDKVQVSVSKLSGGAATGPVTQSWKIAQGSMKGIVYYNTYNSLLAPGGGVMRIRPGEKAEAIIKGCTVCHSVSANGNRLAASVYWTGDPNGAVPGGNPVSSAVWDLSTDGQATQVYSDPDGRKYSFGALSPEGKWMLTSGVPASAPIPRGLTGPYESKLIDAATGVEVPADSFTSVVKYALTPVFSPDSKHVAFNLRDSSPGHVLATMNVDTTGATPVFSGLDTLYTSAKVAAWPSFTPDSQLLVFHEGDSFDTGTWGGGPLYADLMLAHVPTRTVVPLAILNGIKNGQIYLPYGEGEDSHLNYEPTLLPVPIGGYYWVIFTSRRSYGNTICNPATNPHGCELAGGDKKFGWAENGSEFPSPRKKLWIAAIDVGWDGTGDPSHPAFYLPGQELEAGNMRAFAALEPCKQNGSSCDSAAECCNGFCRQNGTDDAGAPLLQCVPPPTGCSQEDEKCTTAADCCDAPLGYTCINGRCAQPAPPK